LLLLEHVALQLLLMCLLVVHWAWGCWVLPTVCLVHRRRSLMHSLANRHTKGWWLLPPLLHWLLGWHWHARLLLCILAGCFTLRCTLCAQSLLGLQAS
jgi:hypothetical protein